MTWELTQELSDNVCQQIIEGKSLRSICKQDGIPSVSTIMKWLGENKEFQEQYARAREAQADTLADEIIDIADNSTDDIELIQTTEGERASIKHSAIQRARLQIDSRKWYAGKLRPKKYGDSTTIKGDADAPITTITRIERTIIDPQE